MSKSCNQADSTGEIRTVPNPRHLDNALTHLRRASRAVSRRQGPDHRTGRKASKRWEKANAVRPTRTSSRSRTAEQYQ